MSNLSLLAPVQGAVAAEPQSVLVEVAPAAIVLAVVLVLITAGAVVALVLEVRRDGYGLERPRPLSREFPWQLEWPAPGARTARSRDSWRFLRG